MLVTLNLNSSYFVLFSSVFFLSQAIDAAKTMSCIFGGGMFRYLYVLDHSRCSVISIFRERRQPTLQALVEFQYKAVNTRQTVTSTDDIHGVEVLHATTSKITKTVRAEKRMRGRRVCQKANPNSAAPTAGGGTRLTTCVGPMAVDHSIPMLLCKERLWR